MDYNSNIYDRNIDKSNACLAGSASNFSSSATSDDPLALEWSRVRKQPNIRSCYEVGNSLTCSDF